MSTACQNGVSPTTSINQLSAEQIAEFLRNHPENLQQIEKLLKTQPENPQTPDLSAAEEKAEREKEDEEPKRKPKSVVKKIKRDNYYVSQVSSKRRVKQNKEGDWMPYANCAMYQEATATCGVVYESSKGKYWVTSAEDEWIAVTETGVKNYLENDRNVPTTAPKGPDGTACGPNPMREAMNFITRASNVEFATTLAGHSAGIYDYDGRRVLVTNSPRIIRPVRGEWPTIRHLLVQMFGVPQIDYLYGWLKIAYESLRSGEFYPGQIVALIGKQDVGKTMIQNLILTPVLGGRDGRPYQYMTAQTPFNSDLFKGEHLIIADETPATEFSERMAFGAAIKQLVAEPKQRMHAKGKDAIMLVPFWRVTMSLNDEPENLAVLPPYNDSLADKLILFKVTRPDNLPGSAREAKRQFAETIAAELPAFLHFLQHEYEIRPEIKKGRFGIAEYCHPDIKLMIEDISPEESLMSLCEQHLFPENGLKDEWEGTASELAAALKGKDSDVSQDARKLFGSNQRLGSMLSNVQKNSSRYKGAITSRVLDGRRVFKLFRQKRWKEIDRE